MSGKLTKKVLARTLKDLETEAKKNEKEFIAKHGEPFRIRALSKGPMRKPEAGLKYDGDKAPLDLFPPEALQAISEVLGYGAKKYAAHNWRLGMSWSRYYAAALRHLNAWNAGQDIDPETGLSHLAHAGCCIAFLIGSAAHGLGTDDRWRKP